MSEIRSTKDYEMFNKNEANRPIDSANLKKLINSIKSQNMLEYRPIVVDNNMKVIDGQHRLEAAKALGCQVYYQVNRESSDHDMILLNTTQKKWILDDYVNYYIKKGYPEYIKYQEYCRKKGVDIMHLIRGDYAGGGNWTNTIRSGKLKFFTSDELQLFEEKDRKYKEFIIHIKKHILSHSPYIDSLRFERAVKMVVKNEDIDWETFVKKCTIKSDALKICPTSESYYFLFLDIYNWKNHKKVYPSVKKTEHKEPEYDSPEQLSMA